MYFKKLFSASLYNNDTFISKCDIVIEYRSKENLDYRNQISVLQNKVTGHPIALRDINDYNKKHKTKYNRSWALISANILERFSQDELIKKLENICWSDYELRVVIDKIQPKRFKKLEI